MSVSSLRVLEEALIAFPGVVCVVSHDRYFLNRVCTDILAFEGDGKIHHSVGDYDYYLEKKQRAAAEAARRTADASRNGTNTRSEPANGAAKRSPARHSARDIWRRQRRQSVCSAKICAARKRV